MLLLYRYGQCWIMAGVAVTLMRALGIASRPVTCYNMASCSGAALARYFTSEGDFVHGITSDVVWLVPCPLLLLILMLIALIGYIVYA